MKNKNLVINLFGMGTICCAVYCLIAGIILQKGLTAGLTALPPYLEAMGIVFIPALLAVGLYHLYLLAKMLRSLAGYFLQSLYVVLILLSGILLFSDVSLLSDIGKEYRLWDVSSQWHMLYAFLAFHIFILVAGVAALNQKSVQAGMDGFSSKHDALFLSIHQIGLISGLLGICGVFFTISGSVVPLRFSGELMVLLAVLALFPLAVILIYWRLQNKKIPGKIRMDEKQFSDTAFASLVCVFLGIAFYIAVCILDYTLKPSLPVSFFMLLLFFLQLTAFSAVILLKNK